MTVQISQRGQRVTSRPLPTTTSSEPRKLRISMRPKHSLVRLPTPKTSGVHEQMGSPFRGEMPGDVGMFGAPPGHELFIPS
jgi:hypothetical protein